MNCTPILLFLLVALSIFSCKKQDCEVNEPIEGCLCYHVYKPVCGCNNITYGNDCEAICAGVSDFKEGECK